MVANQLWIAAGASSKRLCQLDLNNLLDAKGIRKIGRRWVTSCTLNNDDISNPDPAIPKATT